MRVCKMIYSSSTRNYGDGQWHCPYSKEWIKRMRKIVRHCKRLTEQQLDAMFNGSIHMVPVPGEYLNEPQDPRGLPLSWVEEEECRYKNHPTSCTAIYDYCTIPEVVITNGEDDWPLARRRVVITA